MADQATVAKSAAAPNKVQISDVGPSRKKLSIEIPAETVTSQIGTSLDTLLLEAELPGFRKGRAPKRLIERRFGTHLRRESKNQLIASAFQSAVEEHKLQVVGDPIAGKDFDKVEVEAGKPLSFEIEVEVLPAFELPSLDGIAVEKPTMEVTDELVDGELRQLCLQEGELEPREKSSLGDYLTGHAKMIGPDGKVHIDIADAVVQIPTADKNGKGMILGIMVDDFGSQLGLPAVGATVAIKTKGPEQHETEAIRGIDLTIEFTPARIDAIIPVKAEDLAVRYGFENVDGLRNVIKGRVEQRIQMEQRTAMHSQVVRYLIDNTTMELPERLTAGQAARNLSRRRAELMHRGIDAVKIEENIAELRAASGKDAVAELKVFFILSRVAEKLEVTISEAEINGGISAMAARRGVRPEKLRQEMIQRNQISEIYIQMRENKTLEALVAKAVITDVAAKDFKPGKKKK